MRLICIAAVLVAVGCHEKACAARRGENLVGNAGFEADTAWEPVGDGYELDRAVSRSGTSSLMLRSEDTAGTRGARQVITLDPPVRHPFRVSGWSKAVRAEVAQDYSIYLDLTYDDGTPLWGQIAAFEQGTHDWEYSELVFDVARPVRTIEVFVLFRKAKGAVWFDDIRVELVPFEFLEPKVLPGLFGRGSLAVAAVTSLPASWQATVRGSGREVLAQTGGTGPVRLDYIGAGAPRTVEVSAADALLGERIAMTLAVPAGPERARRGYAVWTDTSMTRVMPQALPATAADPPTARISLAGREYESFQVVLLAPQGSHVEAVTLEPSDLWCHATRSRIPARNIQWQQVGFVEIVKPWRHPEVRDAVPGWWPDPLLPVAQFGLHPGTAQSVWVTVYAPDGTPPGLYEGRVTVRPANAPSVEVCVEATVYGFSLPMQGHLKNAFALMDGYLEKLYGKPLSAGLRRKYGDFLLEHRLNPDDISRTSPPEIEDLLHYRERGLNAFNVLNMVEERGEATWVCWSPLTVYTPEFMARLIERLDPYVEALRAHELTDLAYIYTFDERGEEFFPTIRDYFGMVKRRYPEIRTLTTAYTPLDPAVLRDLNVDWACPLTPRYAYEEAERCRAAGHEVWAYICLGPRYPYANWLADDPLIEARVLWWQAYRERMDGFLYWGLNIWDRAGNDRLIVPEDGPFLSWSITTGGDYDWLHGDGELLYAGRDGPIGSIRLANIRDGLEDYEYLWALADISGSVERARAACRPVTASLTSFTRDPAALLHQRDRVARRIERWRARSAL